MTEIPIAHDRKTHVDVLPKSELTQDPNLMRLLCGLVTNELRPLSVIATGLMDPERPTADELRFFLSHVSDTNLIHKKTYIKLLDSPLIRTGILQRDMEDRKHQKSLRQTQKTRVFSLLEKDKRKTIALAGEIAEFALSVPNTLSDYFPNLHGAFKIRPSKEVDMDSPIVTRIKILEHLAQSPTPLRNIDLAQATGIERQRCSAQVASLRDNGILGYEFRRGWRTLTSTISQTPEQNAAISSLVSIIRRFQDADHEYIEAGVDRAFAIFDDPEKVKKLIEKATQKKAKPIHFRISLEALKNNSLLADKALGEGEKPSNLERKIFDILYDNEFRVDADWLTIADIAEIIESQKGNGIDMTRGELLPKLRNILGQFEQQKMVEVWIPNDGEAIDEIDAIIQSDTDLDDE